MINFPDTPALNEVFGPFTWDGVKWTTTPAGVGGDASDALPLMAGVASPGLIEEYSRGDHAHPSDTTRAPLVSPVFSGGVTSDTLTTSAWISVRGSFTTFNGRIVSQMPGAADQPSLCVYSLDRAYAMGMFLDTSNNIAFGNMDGNGVPQNNFGRIDGVGNLSLSGTIVLGRDPINWNDVSTKQYADAHNYGGNYLPLSGYVGMTGQFTSAQQWVGIGHGGDIGTVEVRSADAASDAFIAFHWPGAFGCNFGLSGDTLWFGGWSHGWVAYRFWTTRDFGGYPANNARMVYAGDVQVNVNSGMVEPYGGASNTGGSGYYIYPYYQYVGRYRYMQMHTTGWYTIGYV
jgi:hypothetical protein